MDFRHEWKIQINEIDRMMLRQRLFAVMQLDTHARGGTYQIRSLYFDTPSDMALRDKLNSVNVREKFRLRMYNYDTSFIQLEKKFKVNGLCNKQKAVLDVSQVEALLAGETQWMAQSDSPLVQELYVKMNTSLLRPKTIVDYTREPFVWAPGNVRVTIDSDICTGVRSLDFLNPASRCVAVPGNPIVLEVKWDNFLPDVIRSLVQVPNRRVAAYSKYAQSRRYG